MARLFSALLVFLLCGFPAYAEYAGTIVFTLHGKERTVGNVPRFEDFPAAKPSRKIAKDIDFSSRKNSRRYRTSLRNDLKEGANYNGHYRVTTVGCGSGCQYNWVFDVATGKVLGDFYTALGTQYSPDSALLIADLLEDRPVDLEYYTLSGGPVLFMTVKNGKLKTIHTIPVREFLR